MLTIDLAPRPHGYALVVALAAPHRPSASAQDLAAGLVAVVVAALILLLPCTCYFLLFAVLADRLKAFAVGAPLLPARRIFSPDPALMRARFA